MRRMIFVCGATFAIALATVVSFLVASGDARGQTTVNVDVGDFYFCNPIPGGLCVTNVAAGDTVTWQWVSGTHTVTQCDAAFSTCPPAGGFNSGNLSSSATFSQTFNTPGSFEYRCNLHPFMQGRINVAAAQVTPTPSAGPTPTPSAGPTPSPAAPAAPGPTASPPPAAAPTATRTAAPAAVPGTGGTPADGAPSWPLVLAIAGGVLLIASAGVGVSVLRRR